VADADRGFVGRELLALGHDPDRFGVLRLQDEAENVLMLRSNQHYLSDNHHLAWDDLDPSERLTTSSELLAIVKFADEPSARPQGLIEAGLSAIACEHVLDAMDQYRSSLPLSRAETAWLGGVLRSRDAERVRSAVRPSMYLEWVLDRRQRVVSAGKQVEVDGKELISREWDWLRGGGEFESTSTYETVTTDALRRLSRLFDRETFNRKTMRRERIKY
jgi:hypothetical protein